MTKLFTVLKVLRIWYYFSNEIQQEFRSLITVLWSSRDFMKVWVIILCHYILPITQTIKWSIGMIIKCNKLYIIDEIHSHLTSFLSSNAHWVVFSKLSFDTFVTTGKVDYMTLQRKAQMTARKLVDCWLLCRFYRPKYAVSN